jgi:Fe-S-cluster-containing dehydrogenase component
MAAKWNLVIDVNRCNGCYNCAIAAKDEYVDNREAGYFEPMPRHGQPWVDVIQKERGDFPALDVHYVPVMCNHCDDAPCVKVARDGAARQRADGIVLIDPVKAKGQKQIAEACPYGAAYWNEDLQTVQHWPFDAHLIDRGWSGPRCVEVCATGAITAAKATDAQMARRVADEALLVRNPEFGTRPRVYYKNLERGHHEFIAGCAVRDHDGITDVVIGAKVRITDTNGAMMDTVTDDFGDFRVDGLTRGSGPYEVVVEHEGATASATVDRLDRSRFVGRMKLR